MIFIKFIIKFNHLWLYILFSYIKCSKHLKQEAYQLWYLRKNFYFIPINVWLWYKGASIHYNFNTCLKVSLIGHLKDINNIITLPLVYY